MLIKHNSLIKASELKCGDIVSVVNNTEVKYEVFTNFVGDVLFLVNTNKNTYEGVHLFYDDVADHEWAANKFGIDMLN